MPYRWTHTPDAVTLTLWPHRSLPPAGFAAVILATFVMITIPLVGLLGTVQLWGLLPFLMLALAGLWWGLRRSYRDGEIIETLTLSPKQAQLTRITRDAAPLTWKADPYWVRVEMHQTGGPVPYYLTLTGATRIVEIGAFLSEDERRALCGELGDALRNTSKFRS